MHHALRLTVSTFGLVAGLAGLEHGLGELLQGDRAPAGLVIESWPDAPAFRILAGEPALTLIPNLRLTGLLAIITSLALMVWVMVFIERRRGALGLFMLSLLLFLVGGGFGPPLLGLILSVAATRLHRPQARADVQRAHGTRRRLAELWPWAYGVGLATWLTLVPGSVIVAALFALDGTSEPAGLAIAVLTLIAFAMLLLTIVAAQARDRQPPATIQPPAEQPAPAHQGSG